MSSPQGLYLLLITNKGSNILEDLDTLRLLSKTVPEYVHPVDEEGVSAGAFELIFAFDEVISMGHRESITVAQVCLSSQLLFKMMPIFLSNLGRKGIVQTTAVALECSLYCAIVLLLSNIQSQTL